MNQDEGINHEEPHRRLRPHLDGCRHHSHLRLRHDQPPQRRRCRARHEGPAHVVLRSGHEPAPVHPNFRDSARWIADPFGCSLRVPQRWLQLPHPGRWHLKPIAFIPYLLQLRKVQFYHYPNSVLAVLREGRVRTSLHISLTWNKDTN